MELFSKFPSVIIFFFYKVLAYEYNSPVRQELYLNFMHKEAVP